MSTQRTLSLDSREFRPADYDRLVEIYNANYPDYAVSVAEVRSRDDSIDKSKYLLKRSTWLDSLTGATVGFGELRHVMDMFDPRKFMISVWVDPLEQGRGVGGAIYEGLAKELKDLSAIVVWTMNREDLRRHREFFLRRGFQEKMRDWESRLDLTTVDLSKFQEYFQKVSREGITFTTLAEERRHGRASLSKLHELVQLITADMPREVTFTPLSYENWKTLEFNNPRLILEGYVIAKHSSDFVGLSVVYRNERDPQNLTQGDTGVRREFRGKGIATALKLKVIEFAQKNGYQSIKTWNDSANAAMLAVNVKLGFKRQVGWIRMEKLLS
jgi:GNAT superfamily N-acetyltransferase